MPERKATERPGKRGAAALLRPPGLLVFAGVVVLIGLVWWLFADTWVRRGIEATGASIVGARVDLESADLRPTEGTLRLRGLQVTNPSAPMTNLMEAEEITVDLMLEPLLSKKVFVQNLVVTGVRFNTPREESGALEDADSEAGTLWRQVDEWAAGIDVPELSFEGLGGVIRTEAIDADSLATVRRARELVSRTDSLRQTWEAQVTALDPRPRVDSLRAVVERLEAFRLTPLSAVQLPGLVRDGRAALEGLTALRDEVGALDDEVRAGFSSLQEGVETLPELRTQDLAYARSLLNIPSLEAPELSPALFGGTALTWLKPVLFWARTAERYLPPGLDPRNRPGPERTRAEGVTVEFPGRATYPAFTIGQGELGLEIGGTGLAAGEYSARIRDLSTAPSLLGRPMELVVGRTAGAAEGPRELSLAAVLDHTGDVIRDSVALSIVGLDLPEVDLDVFGGALLLGEGTSSFDLSRVGDEIDARLRWVSDDLTWLASGGDAEAAPEGGSADRSGGDSVGGAAAAQGPQAGGPAIGSAEWAEALIARTISGIERVELDMSLHGSMESPSLSISSNLGQAVAESLRNELGQQIEAAEARVRAEVDERVQPLIQQARGGVDAVRNGVVGEVAAQRREVEELRARLEERLQALAGA